MRVQSWWWWCDTTKTSNTLKSRPHVNDNLRSVLHVRPTMNDVYFLNFFIIFLFLLVNWELKIRVNSCARSVLHLNEAHTQAITSIWTTVFNFIDIHPKRCRWNRQIVFGSMGLHSLRMRCRSKSKIIIMLLLNKIGQERARRKGEEEAVAAANIILR